MTSLEKIFGTHNTVNKECLKLNKQKRPTMQQKNRQKV